MPTVDFYKNLGYDFYQYEDEEELRGLTPDYLIEHNLDMVIGSRFIECEGFQ